MSKLQGEILNLPKMSGNVGAKTINIGGKGEDGATFIPSVSTDGVISWTNDKELPNPVPVKIKGEPGKDGKDGTSFTPDETLSLNENGVLSVNTAHEPDPDNTLPITAAAVAQTLGNVETLLRTI